MPLYRITYAFEGEGSRYMYSPDPPEPPTLEGDEEMEDIVLTVTRIINVDEVAVEDVHPGLPIRGKKKEKKV